MQRPRLTHAYFGNSALLQLHIRFIPLLFKLKPANRVFLSKVIRRATGPVSTSVITKRFPVSKLLKGLPDKAPSEWHVTCVDDLSGDNPGLGVAPGVSKHMKQLGVTSSSFLNLSI